MNITPQNAPITILLAEDNPADAELTRYALEESGLKHILQIVEDGEEALSYLACGGKYKDAAIPDLIFLDLNLPKISGMEVLKTIKNSDNLKNVPIAILTSSQVKTDITDSYRLDADYYITKPIDAQKILVALGSSPNAEWFLL